MYATVNWHDSPCLKHKMLKILLKMCWRAFTEIHLKFRCVAHIMGIPIEPNEQEFWFRIRGPKIMCSR
jgi:hypothetical protein